MGRNEKTGLSTVYIDIYTSSEIDVNYSIEVNYFQSFVLSESSNTSIQVSPFAPVFFEYRMKSESTIVEFQANDKICTTVSVQRMICPIFDLRHTVDFNGQYQTMTKSASISVTNSDLQAENLFIVISVHPNDIECCERSNCSGSDIHRIKNITVMLKPGYNHSKVNLSFAITLSVFLAIYIFICPFLCFIEPYSEKNLKHLINEFHKSETILSTSTNVTPLPTSSNQLSNVLSKENFNSLENQIAKHLDENLLDLEKVNYL